MSTPTDPPHRRNVYSIDTDNAAEVARVSRRDRFFIKNMGGLFPELANLSSVHDILDVACGPGEWTLETAITYPDIQVMGIDRSPLKIAYAQAAANDKGLDNIRFKEMDIPQLLDFPDNSFDIINGRFLCDSLFATDWSRLLQECVRIARPGGTIRLVDSEFGLSNSSASERLNALIADALKKAGQSFSPDGRHIGITPMLGRLLRDAGCRNIQRMAHAIDYSFGAGASKEAFQAAMTGYKLAQPFLIRTGVTTQKEMDRLYQQAMEEIQSTHYCALGICITTWGEVPS